MATSEVRLAAGNDAAELARIQRETWRFAYADLLPEAALLALRDGDGLDEAVADAIRDRDTTVLIATEGDSVVGWCVAGPAPDAEPARDGTGLLGTLLVEPRWARRGHGGRLLDAAIRSIAEQGLPRCVTWVPEPDTASQGFFAKAGWEPDGTVRTLDATGTASGRTVVRELRLALEL